MPLNLDIKRKFTQSTARVKSIDFHPKEQWFLTALYTGHVCIWNLKTDALIKSIECSPTPVRTARFFPTQPWIVAGCDDKKLHIVNYTTGEHVQTLQGHVDYIRSIAMHPTLPYFLTGSDDGTIKLWDFSKRDDIQCVRTFAGHQYFVMQVIWSPHDANMFASASLDKTLKIWNINNPQASFTLHGHTDGVNCLAFYPSKDKPYLISGADDCTIRVWDYQTQSVITTLSGHSKFITSVMYHPTLPIFFSGSEDFCVRIWHSHTYQCEQRLFYNLDRSWCIGISPRSNHVVLGYDDGLTVIKLGKNHPMMSVDQSGRVVYAGTNSTHVLTGKVKIPSLSDQSNNIMTEQNGEQDISLLLANKDFLQQNDTNPSLPDGTKLSLTTKELGTLDKKPTTLQHSPDGKAFVVCDGTDYIIYTALSMNPVYHGSGQEIVWGAIPNQQLDSSFPTYGSTSNSTSLNKLNALASKYSMFYAVRENATSVQIYGDNEVLHSIDFDYDVQQLFGGNLLAIRGEGFIDFYDWITATPIHRIDAHARSIQWSDNGNSLSIITDSSLYLLKYDHNYLLWALEQKLLDEDEIDYETNPYSRDLYDPEEPFGIENSFSIIFEYEEKVRNGLFVKNCFVFITSSNKIQYLVQDSVLTVTYSELSSLYIVGYLNGYILCVDKSCQLYLYSLPQSMIMFQTMVVENEVEQAMKMIHCNLQGIAYEPTGNIAQLLGFDASSSSTTVNQDQQSSTSNFGEFGFGFDSGTPQKHQQQENQFMDSFGFDSAPSFSATTQQTSTSISALMAAKLQPSSLEKLATFLEQRGLFNEALQLCQDEEHRFNLSILARNFRAAISMLRTQYSGYIAKYKSTSSLKDANIVDFFPTINGQVPLELRSIYDKWKQLGDISLTQLMNIPLAQYCYTKGCDYASLLFLFALFKDIHGLKWLAQKSSQTGMVNIAFYASLFANDPQMTISILLQQNCFPEAALFSRTYSPSTVELIVPYWKSAIVHVNQQLADMIIAPPLAIATNTAPPTPVVGLPSYPPLITSTITLPSSISIESFPNWGIAIQAEEYLKQTSANKAQIALPTPSISVQHQPLQQLKSQQLQPLAQPLAQPLQPPPSYTQNPTKLLSRVPSANAFHDFSDPQPFDQPQSFEQPQTFQQPFELSFQHLEQPITVPSSSLEYQQPEDDFGFGNDVGFDMTPSQTLTQQPPSNSMNQFDFSSHSSFEQPPPNPISFHPSPPAQQQQQPEDDFGFDMPPAQLQGQPPQAHPSHSSFNTFQPFYQDTSPSSQNDFFENNTTTIETNVTGPAPIDTFEEDLSFFTSPSNNNISSLPSQQPSFAPNTSFQQPNEFTMSETDLPPPQSSLPPFNQPFVKPSPQVTHKPAITTFNPFSSNNLMESTSPTPNVGSIPQSNQLNTNQFNNNDNNNNTNTPEDGFFDHNFNTDTTFTLPQEQFKQTPETTFTYPSQVQQAPIASQAAPTSVVLPPVQFHAPQVIPTTFSAPTFQSPQPTTTIAAPPTTAQTPTQFYAQQQPQSSPQQPQQLPIQQPQQTQSGPPQSIVSSPSPTNPSQLAAFTPLSPLKPLQPLQPFAAMRTPLQPLQSFKPLTSPAATSTISTASTAAALPGIKPLQPLQPLKLLQPLKPLQPLQPLQPLKQLQPLPKP